MTSVSVERIERPYVGGEIIDWYAALPIVRLQDYTGGRGIVVIDMINGFVHEGPLSGPRVAALALPIRNFVVNSYNDGLVRLFVSLQDTHRANAIEFQSYPAHAIEGTKESELIPELDGLVKWTVFEKDTLNVAASPRSGFNSALLGWTEKRNPSKNAEELYTETFFLVGNCTDLCVYQTAMHMKQFYNACGRTPRIVVVADLTDTYDAPWHPGDFYHKVFLKHMEQNGIEIVRDIV